MKRSCALWIMLLLLLTGCGKEGHTVTFDPNGGQVISGETKQRVAPGESAVAPVVEREGHKLRWDRDFSAVTENMTVTALWEAEVYTVRFDVNGGVLIRGESEERIPYGESAAAPTAELGRRLLHWDRDFSAVTEDMTVTARWELPALSEEEVEEVLRKCTAELTVLTVQGGRHIAHATVVRPDGILITSRKAVETAESILAQLSDGQILPVMDFCFPLEGEDVALLHVDATALPWLAVREEEEISGRYFTLHQGMFCTAWLHWGEGESFPRGDGEGTLRGGAVIDGHGELVGFWSQGGSDAPLVPGSVFAQLLRAPYGENWGVSMGEAAMLSRVRLTATYSPRDEQGNYHYSLLANYQSVTGAKCRSSVNSDAILPGYIDCCDSYVYELREEEKEAYTVYLTAQGYMPKGEEAFEKGVSQYYYNERDGIWIDLFSTHEGELWIWVKQKSA